MIDGLYLRQGLKSAPISIAASQALVEDYVSAELAQQHAGRTSQETQA